MKSIKYLFAISGLILRDESFTALGAEFVYAEFLSSLSILSFKIIFIRD